MSELEGIRLQKVLASAGLGSRRKCEEFITAGRVTVNDVLIDELGARVHPETDVIRVDGVRIAQAAGHVVVALNKPRGVVTSMSDEHNRECVGDLVAQYPERLFHVGSRGAMDIEGLGSKSAAALLIDKILKDEGNLFELTAQDLEKSEYFTRAPGKGETGRNPRAWTEKIGGTLCPRGYGIIIHLGQPERYSPG